MLLKNSKLLTLISETYFSSPEMVTDDKEIEKWLKSIKSQEVYKPVTPQMLVDALQYPLLLRDGANIDVIVRRLSK